MKTELLMQSQAAALANMTARRLRQIQQEDGSIPRSIDEEGKLKGYPANEFGLWLRSRFAREIGASPDGNVYDERLEKARLTHHQANNEALKENQLRGELMPAELVIELGAALVGAARAKVLAIHSKIRSRFPGIDRDLADEVERLSHEALSELGSDGIPADIRRRIAPAVRRLESAAGSDN